MSRRRSNTSAAAPAANENSMIGSTVEACTRATTSAVGASDVMSHDAPTDWISPPKLETRLATQSARKTWCLKGPSGAARGVFAGASAVLSAPMIFAIALERWNEHLAGLQT